MKDLAELTEEQLQAELERRRAAKREQEKREREAYEAERNTLVESLVSEAVVLNRRMSDFKQTALARLNQFAKLAYRYGDIRSNSKGGFSLRSSDGTKKVALVRNTKTEYDERADLAEELIRDFLADMVKKRDLKTYNLLSDLLERGKHNEFNPANIAVLLKHEHDFEDPRWKKAMKLFKESYNLILISMNVEFYQKNSMDKDQAITLTFASIPVNEEVETGDNSAEQTAIEAL